MAYELEVSDRVTSWTAEGKTYRPGIYVVDEATANAANRNAALGIAVSVREVDDAGEAVTYTEDEPTGAITKADLTTQNDTTDFVCLADCGVKPFRTERNRDKHMSNVHPDYEAPPAAEEGEDAPLFTEVVEEDEIGDSDEGGSS